MIGRSKSVGARSPEIQEDGSGFRISPGDFSCAPSGGKEVRRVRLDAAETVECSVEACASSSGHGKQKLQERNSGEVSLAGAQIRGSAKGKYGHGETSHPGDFEDEWRGQGRLTLAGIDRRRELGQRRSGCSMGSKSSSTLMPHVEIERKIGDRGTRVRL